jgi:hypothetical protein
VGVVPNGIGRIQTTQNRYLSNAFRALRLKVARNRFCYELEETSRCWPIKKAASGTGQNKRTLSIHLQPNQMTTYTVFFELFGKKYKMKVQAESKFEAEELIKEKIIFHKIVDESKAQQSIEDDFYDTTRTLLNALKNT